MGYEFVIDTYAWIEYFSGSAEGEIARDCIDGPDIATPSIVVLEFRKSLLRRIAAGEETVKGAKKMMDFVRSNSTIVDLNYHAAMKSAELDVEMKKKVRGWGIADSIVLATAGDLNAKVVTGDEHFRGLKEAVMIK